MIAIWSERQIIAPLGGLMPPIEPPPPGPGWWDGAALPGTVPHQSGVIARRLILFCALIVAFYHLNAYLYYL